jgi:hypothetical protein
MGRGRDPRTPDHTRGWASRSAAGVVALCLVAGAILTATAFDPASSSAQPGDYGFCPPARRLIGPWTHWHRHQLAPGISLSETMTATPRGRLKVAVVRVGLGRHDHDRHRAAVAPVHQALTTRRPLSRMARRRHLVAATNGGYFSLTMGAPTEALIGRGGPLILSRHHSRVAGIGTDGRARDAHVWLAGHVRTAHGRHRLGALNEVTPPHGLSLYTSDWGARPVAMGRHARSRVVHGDHVTSPVERHRHVPRHGDLLVATTRSAVRWLHSLRRSSPVAVSYRAKSNAPVPFTQAYAVGTRVVASAHHVRNGLYCRRGEIYAARTDIAWTDHGRSLMLATVNSPRGSDNYGVDENQMSQVMVKLGADRSYALDGGGSTELIARLPGHHGLSIRTRRHEHERRIPVGIGVYSMPVRHPRKHHKPAGHKHHKRHHAPKQPTGPLGGLIPLP